MEKIHIERIIALVTFAITVVLVIIDGFFLHYGSPFDGYGLASTFVLPPIGCIASVISVKKTGSKLDVALILMNVFAFFSIFLYMFLGTMFMGS
ncbi:hypothetical protein [Paenibacillus solani]|uniref:hypothetical protein n=1 Tax=Paenibacillus solani TaxID=1705565 RepID=UPI003D27B6B4